MQQTETYKLNLIDPADAFSPDPLNDNMRKVETRLTALDAADHKIAFGSYTVDSTEDRTIELPFTPKVAYVGNALGHLSSNYGYTFGGLALENAPVMYERQALLTIVPGGLKVTRISNDASTNNNGSEYRYLVIG